jgi:hypothetical protein
MEKYRQEVKEYLENLSDEEFKELFRHNGIELIDLDGRKVHICLLIDIK